MKGGVQLVVGGVIAAHFPQRVSKATKECNKMKLSDFPVSRRAFVASDSITTWDHHRL